MISIDQAAEVFQQHADEILYALSKTPRRHKVIAEVDRSGRWLGTSIAKAGEFSKLAENKEGYAIHFYPELDKKYSDVLIAIDNWLDDRYNEALSRETSWWWR